MHHEDSAEQSRDGYEQGSYAQVLVMRSFSDSAAFGAYGTMRFRRECLFRDGLERAIVDTTGQISTDPTLKGWTVSILPLGVSQLCERVEPWADTTTGLAGSSHQWIRDQSFGPPRSYLRRRFLLSCWRSGVSIKSDDRCRELIDRTTAAMSPAFIFAGEQ